MKVSLTIGFQYFLIGNKNNIGQIENVYSQDGKTNFFEYDFKNNLLTLKKRFAIDYQNVLDWNETVPLQSEEFEFVEQTTYDALNRPITITQPDTTVASYVYNKGGLLEQVLHDATTYISNIDYNEKGQRSKVNYGNGTQTRHTYDSKSFRLTDIYTIRNGATDALQDIHYTFDAVGNIVQQKDNAQQTYYYSNQVIAPNAKYTYDPLYRLINATGRELTSLTAPTPNDFTNSIGVPNTAANAMQTYNHTYEFDELGNMQSDNWKDYVYDTTTNRLLKHDPNQTLNDYTYDAHGNMLTMPHLTSMVWDFADRLQSAGNGTFTSYYNYDLGGNRSRKVVVKSNIREERYYLGDYEIYRKYVNDTKTLERSTVHIIDDRDRFAMIETETGNNPVVRYQYNNHLGSACLELDSTAAIISYEEYHPYGTTSYRSGRTETEVSLKRYKYVGKERDEETGLYYYGARYYAAWICRFVSVDALQHKYPELTPYQYASNRPITGIDLDGLEFVKPEQAKIRLGYNSINWNTDNISGSLLSAITTYTKKQRNKYDEPSPDGGIETNVVIQEFNIDLFYKSVNRLANKNIETGKYVKSYKFEDNGYGKVNDDSETFSPKQYNSTRVTQKGYYDKRCNTSFSDYKWFNSLNASKFGAWFTLITESIKIADAKLKNDIINEDVRLAKNQSVFLGISIDLYQNAVLNKLIPKAFLESASYIDFRKDVINYVFCGELPSELNSFSYKDAKGMPQSISGKEYQKMIKEFGTIIFNSNPNKENIYKTETIQY